MSYQPKHRASTPADEFMELFHAAKERNKERYRDREKPYCQEIEDCLDGYVIHAPACPYYQDTAVSGTGCIQ